MQMKIKGKLAFPSVYTPTTFNGEGAAQFKAICILEADDPQVALLDQTTDQVGSEKWTNKWASVKKELLQRDKTFVHDGDLKSHLDGFAGRKFISASSKFSRELAKLFSFILFSNLFFIIFSRLFKADESRFRELLNFIFAVEFFIN